MILYSVHDNLYCALEQYLENGLRGDSQRAQHSVARHFLERDFWSEKTLGRPESAVIGRRFALID